MIGKTVKFIGCQENKPYSNYNAPYGTELKITGLYKATGYNVTKTDGPSENYGYVYFYEIAPLSSTAEEITEEIKRKEDELTELKSKLAFINKIGSDKFDDDEFKAFQILETIGISDIQKAREIVRILSK
jgi:hypothetical protein